VVHAALLVLVDGRLPAGGYAHSGGVEAFVRRGELHDLATLRDLLATRLETIGFCDATVAVAALLEGHAGTDRWDRLDAEAGARIASPALRTTSRILGRQLVRTARRMWPDPRLDGVSRVHTDGPHHAVALGAAGLAARLDAGDVAAAALYGAIAGPATAAVRLLGLDPVDAHALVASMTEQLDAIATAAVSCVVRVGLENAPAPSASRLEIAAEEHATQEVRLFAS
jgi:urease accessory protein